MSDAMVRGYASLPFSQALVEEYSGVTSSDGAQSAQLSGNPTQLAYLPPDRMTAFCRLSRYGMTFRPLTESLGQDVLTSYLAAFPARTLAQPDEAPVLKESDPECGVIWRESLAKYDQDSSTWKTPQCSLLEDSTKYLGTWPRWGLMRDGVSYRQQTLVPRIKEIGSGLWATPSASDGQRGGTITDKMTGQSLTQMVNTPAKWPTPTTMDCIHRSRESWEKAQNRPRQGKNLIKLGDIGYWPTPTAHNAKETNAPSESQRNTPTLASQAGGTLNPTWVEWLMGWPLGWTDLKPLEMDRFQQWQQQHGIY
jgi:hypothetical protein